MEIRRQEKQPLKLENIFYISQNNINVISKLFVYIISSLFSIAYFDMYNTNVIKYVLIAGAFIVLSII